MTDSSNIYFRSEISAEEPEPAPEKEKPEYTKAECLLSLITAVLAFGFIKFVVFNTTGFITTALYIAIITTVIIYLKSKSYKFSGVNVALAAILYLFSFVFSVTANDLIKLLDAVFLFGAGAYFVYSVTADKSDIDRFLPYAMIKAVFEYPFSKFGAQGSITKEATVKTRFGNNIKMILLGLVLTVPLTSIVAVLLMSADDGLEKLLSGMLHFIFSDSIWQFIIQVLIAVPCSCYLFGMLYANSFRKDINILDNESCENKLASVRSIQNMVIYTAITPIYILYVMFFISQANYFLSAFEGNLPSGYSYADYARRGFFELFAVTFINLAVIVIANLFAKESGRKKPAVLKIYTVTLSFFTLILIATAVSKMAMYISVYGLTRLRVYTTWFMLLCAVIFVMIIIKQFKFDFRFARWSSAAFTVMFALLCFCRPDALIAEYNINMYQSGALNELDTDELLDMSDDSVLAALKNGVVSAEDAAELRSDKFNENPYSKYNISSLILSYDIDN